MSLILDALRRAEQDRKAGHAPGLHDAPESAEASPRNWAPLLTGGGMLLLGLAALIWAWRSSAPAHRPAQSAVPSTSAPAQAAGRAVPSPALSGSVAAESMDDLLAPEQARTPPQAAPVPPPDIAIAPVDLGTKPQPQKPAKEPALADRRSIESAQQDAPARLPPATALPDPVQSAQSDGTSTTVDIPAPAAENSEVASAEPAAQENPFAGAPEVLIQGNAPTPLKDMPREYRADFPQFKVDVHVYNDEPRRRFVLIDLKRYREGEKLAGGAQIVQIVHDGIVFNHRGEHVLYQLQR